MHYLPTALDMSFLRPHFFEIQNKAYWPAIAEIYGLLILSVLILFFKRKNIPPSLVTILWVNFSIAFSLLLIEGYTVTFVGGIVRYRSLVFPLLFASVITIADIEKMKRCLKHH